MTNANKSSYSVSCKPLLFHSAGQDVGRNNKKYASVINKCVFCPACNAMKGIDW